MLKELFYSSLGATTLIKQKVEDELSTLENKGKIKKKDVEKFLKSLEKEGRKEDKRVKEEIKSLLKETINELGIATKKDIKKLKKELKNKQEI